MYFLSQCSTSPGPKSKQKYKTLCINNTPGRYGIHHYASEGHWELVPEKYLSFVWHESHEFFFSAFCMLLLCAFLWCFGKNLEPLQWKMRPLLWHKSYLIYLWQDIPFTQHKSSSSLMMSFPIMWNIKIEVVGSLPWGEQWVMSFSFLLAPHWRFLDVSPEFP